MNVDTLLDELVNHISRVQGVQAIVLGGSRARGTHTATSDLDLGIYYDPEQPLDLVALNRLATAFDDQHRTNLLTPINGWGPWINGGGWLTVRDLPVDFLYRDLTHVANVIAAAQGGQVEMVYQPGHPHGFVSSIYMGEVALCRSLWDGQKRLAALKAQTVPYPVALKRALIERFAWEADFSLKNAHKAASRGDVTYVAGCCFRTVACVLQSLFAFNEQYWLNEKGALVLAATFPHSPPALRQQVETVFEHLAAKPEALTATLAQLKPVVQAVTHLVNAPI